MRDIIGVTLLVLGTIAGFASRLLLLQMEVDLSEKSPVLKEQIARRSWFANPYEITRLYKSEFPKGKRNQQSWFLFVIGGLALLVGVAILVKVK
jgi:hypothetical protein